MISLPTRPQGGALFARHARWHGVFVLAAAGLALATGSLGQAQLEATSPLAPPRSKLIYTGDAYFPPFEYKDARGRAQGFNIQLLKIAAEEAGYGLEFRLAPWADAVASLESGQADLLAVAYSGERAERYDLLS
ncbi:MAG: transporter substrate-binding domain-containing protein, partial [Vicinamibacteria bacterium]|nr:transporter substrate-binding domain-containing protein [Vicinamibacteria bacterium]